MDTNKSPENSAARPFFLPPNIDWETLPAAVRTAIDDVVSPVYQTYVLANADVLQRSTGMSLAYLLTYEVIEQVDVGRVMFTSSTPDDETQERRQRQMDRYLRVVGAKQRCTDLLIRLQTLREKQSLQ